MISLNRNRLLIEAVTNGGVLGLDVPRVRQSTSCSCGAASLLAVLRYWRVMPDAKDEVLFQALDTSCEEGTPANNIVKLAKRFGLTARVSNNTSLATIRAAIADGVAPILNFQAWPTRKTRPLTDRQDGHYAVLVALDAENAYFMDPSITKFGWIPLDEFERAWHDQESAGWVTRRAILIRGKSHLGRRKLHDLKRIETGR